MAKAMTLKQRIGMRILKHRVNSVLKRYRKEFESIMDTNGIKTDYKFPLFIIYFIQQITHNNMKPAKILRELDEKGVIGSYARLSHKIDAHTGTASPKEAADEFAETLIKFIGEKKSDLNKNKVSALVYNVIKLIQLTDNAPQFDISAKKNLVDNYENKITTAIDVTKAISNVQQLLVDTMPEMSNDLILLINNLIRKLFK